MRLPGCRAPPGPCTAVRRRRRTAGCAGPSAGPGAPGPAMAPVRAHAARAGRCEVSLADLHAEFLLQDEAELLDWVEADGGLKLLHQRDVLAQGEVELVADTAAGENVIQGAGEPRGDRGEPSVAEHAGSPWRGRTGAAGRASGREPDRHRPSGRAVGVQREAGAAAGRVEPGRGPSLRELTDARHVAGAADRL